VVERRFQALVIKENLNTLCVEFEQPVSGPAVLEVLVIEENLNTLCVEFEQPVSYPVVFEVLDSMTIEVLDSMTIEEEVEAPLTEVFVRELE
jgi:hypothetical protein